MAFSSPNSTYHTSPNHRSFSTHRKSPARQGHPISPMRDEDNQPKSPVRDEDINDDIEFVTRDDFRKTQEDIVKSNYDNGHSCVLLRGLHCQNLYDST